MRVKLSLLWLAGWFRMGNCMAQLPQAATGAPIPFELKGGRPMIQARLNGVPVGLLLDMGGYATVALIPKDAQAVGARRTDATQTSTTYDGRSQAATGLHFDSLMLGPIDFGAVTGSETPGAKTSYVGAGLLGKHLMVLDYPHQQLRLYASGDKEALRRECGASTFTVNVVRGVLQSQLVAQGKTLTAAWDTGANFSVIRPSALNLQVPDYVPGTQPSMQVLESVQINQNPFGNLNAALIEFKAPPVDMVLGANFFQGRVVCLDGPAQVGAAR